MRADMVEAPGGAGGDAAVLHVSPDDPGFRRHRSGKGFRYVDCDGGRIEDPATLDRIRGLAIPPAWSSVWICPDPAGHIQATGRDAKGRKQYIYHAGFRAVQERTKFGHLVEFATGLPALRVRIAADMARRGMCREKVVATVVHLLERTLIRVGNEAYAKDNGSYGLTTLRDPHVAIAGERLRFIFRGKSGKEWQVELRDRRLARVVRACQDIPGQRLFQYFAPDGSRHSVSSSDVNAYLREATGRDVTAKDFRTWTATVLMAQEARAREEAGPPSRRAMNALVSAVAARLGNTPTVCRASYIHPEIIAASEAGTCILSRTSQRGAESMTGALDPDETAVLRFLRRMAAATERAAA